MSHLDDCRKHRLKIREYQQFGIIYKATLITDGRSYIGQTIRSLKERTSEHSNRGRFYINYAIKKHGSENFNWEIIDYADSQDELDRKEANWIEHYRSNIKGFGFNLTCGGDHVVYNEATRLKISLSKMGIKNPMFGKKQSKETIKKRSASMKGMRNYTVKVKCVETGKIYDSMKEASYETGISPQQLYRVIRSGKKSKKYNLSFVKHGGGLSLT